MNLSPSAACFLTQRPSTETIEFASQLSQTMPSIDIFIAIDDDNISIPSSSSSSIQFIQVNEIIAIEDGYQQSSVFGSEKICSVWDKALYYFARISTNYSFVWFIEEDVFIPSFQAFRSLHELYSSSYDLVTSELHYNIQGDIHSWYHWYLAPERFIIPWAHGMVCAVGCSRSLLSAIDYYARWRGEVAFLEFLFHTIAIHNKQMKIVTPYELNTIAYRQKISFEQVKARPNNWWHPLKSIRKRQKWRNNLMNDSLTEKMNMLKKFYSSQKNITNSIDLNSTSTLQTLLVDFEIIKGQINSSERCQLRDEFFQLAVNQSNEVSFLLKHLADHAFKLPELHVDTIQNEEKTKDYIAFEKDIISNKEMIFQLTKNNDTLTNDQMIKLVELREETKRLIKDLVHEIQCERQYIECERTNEFDQDMDRSIACIVMLGYRMSKLFPSESHGIQQLIG
ncbi:hypothetical protein I4U23_000264 [Adineta vaga]|nr:hypothetical protein I4U23_000264 [Adineta vaga]